MKVNKKSLRACLALAALCGLGLGGVTPVAAAVTETGTNTKTDNATVNDSKINQTAIGYGAKTTATGYTNDGGTAIGYNAHAYGKNAVAIGQANALAETAVAIGYSASTGSGLYAIAIGEAAHAYGTGNVVIGKNANSEYVDYTLTLGANAKTTQDRTVALGNESSTWGEKSVALGAYSSATEDYTVSVGHQKGDKNYLGNEYTNELLRRLTNVASGTANSDAATVGQLVDAQAVTITTEGADSTTTSYTPYKPEDGIVTVKTNNGGTAFTLDLSSLGGGDCVIDTGTDTSQSSANNWLSTDFDTTSVTHGLNSTAYGYKANAAGDQSTAIGYGAYATMCAISIGGSAEGWNSIALGVSSSTTQSNAVAIGYGSSAEGSYSVALGNQSVATEAKTVSVGRVESGTKGETGYKNAITRKIVNVTDGEADTDAATVGQLKAEVKPSSNGKYVLTTNTTGANLLALDTQVKTNTTEITKLTNMTNLTETGIDQIKTYARDAVAVASGEGLEVSCSDLNGKRTYKLKAHTAGVASDASDSLVTGSTVFSEVRPTDGTYVKKTETTAKNLKALDDAVVTKANLDASNIGMNLKDEDGEDAAETDQLSNSALWAAAIGTGTVASTSNQLVTGATVYSEVRDGMTSTNYISSGRTTAVNLSALDNKIGKITDTTVTTVNQTYTVSKNLELLDKAVKAAADSQYTIQSGSENTLTVSTDTNNKTVTITAETGDITYNSKKLVTGMTVYNAIHANDLMLGYNNTITSSGNGTAVGSENTVQWSKSNAFGYKNKATGYWSTALGIENEAMGNLSSVSVGYRNAALADNAAAIGVRAVASGKNSAAFGYKSYAGADNATAIGNGAVASTAGTISFGHKKNDFSGYYLNSTDEFSSTAKTGYDAYYYTSDSFTRLVNVADGIDDHDVATVGQVKAKANIDASNLGTKLKAADGTTAAEDDDIQTNLNLWGAALGTGTVASDSAQLITGKTVYSEVRPETDGTYVKTGNTTAVNLSNLDSALVAQQKLISLDKTTGVGTIRIGSDSSIEADTVSIAGQYSGRTLTGLTAGKEDNDAATVGQMNVAIGEAISGSAYTFQSRNEDTLTVSTDTNNKTVTITAVTGDISASSNGLVTGGTVYAEVRPADGTYVKKDSTTAVNLKNLDDAIGSNTNIATEGGTIQNGKSVNENLKLLDGQVKTNTDAISALEATVTEKGTELSGQIAEVNSKVDAVNSKVDAVDSKVDAVDTKVDAVDTKIDSKIGSLDSTATYKVINAGNTVSQNLAALDNAITGTVAPDVSHLKEITRSDGATAEGTDSLALGKNSTANGTNSISFGTGSTVTGANSIAVGTGHTVCGDNSGAFGDPSEIHGKESYALGNNNVIGDHTQDGLVGNNTFVVGNNVKTTANNAVILGNNSTATEDNVVSVGSEGNERKITNVAAGENDTDAVNYAQLKEAMQSSTEGINQALGSLSNDINKVGAGAAALAALRPEDFNPDDKWSFAVGFGHYKNANAGAFGAFYKPNQDTTVSVGSTIGNGDPMMNVGVSFKIGARSKGASIYSSNVELVREVNSLRAGDSKQKQVINEQAKRIIKLESENAACNQKIDAQAKEIGVLKEENAEMKAQIAQIMKKLDLSGTVKKTMAAH